MRRNPSGLYTLQKCNRAGTLVYLKFGRDLPSRWYGPGVEPNRTLDLSPYMADRTAKSAGIAILTVALSPVFLSSCGKTQKVQAHDSAAPAGVTVGVAPVTHGALSQTLTMSSELVPFQQIDVYAKQSGYVKQLLVDYGTHVRAGQTMAVLEIPELELVLKEDDATIKRTKDQAAHAAHDLARVQAQHQVAHLQYKRLADVAKTQPGLVAEQEVDDAKGKDLAAEAQVEGAQSAFEAAQGQLAEAQAKRDRDQVLYNYTTITAPFSGVVTQRFANLGTLVQAGTSSSTQAMPIARLAQDDKFRLVIPVPESYVRFIRIGDPVKVSVPSLQKTYEGRVARFAMDVTSNTRTMHTEVDVPNTHGDLIPGVYADATLTFQNKPDALQVPLQAVNHEGNGTSVYVIGPGNTIEDRPVTLGVQSSTGAEVLSGLSAGDMVVVSDRSSLKPGEAVKTKVVQPMNYHDASEG